MPTHRKLRAAAFALALVGGGAVGVALGSPTLSSAQDDTTSATTPDPEPRPLRAHRGDRLATAAEALGITEDDLRTELRAGRSIAQVAETEGVDVQTVIDALVSEATARLAEVEAALPERMSELVNREGVPDRGPGRKHHRHPPVPHDDVPMEDDEASEDGS